jgi:hypothetical protein
MEAAFSKALTDSLAMLPFLAGIYMLVEWIEYRLGEGLAIRIRQAGAAGPFLGAVFGCIPQCGFSVMSGALYARGLVSRGTLLAVFLSTSDEALPVILSQPGATHLVLPLLGTKVVIALVGGFLVDLLMRPRLATAPEPTNHVEHDACCGHHVPRERDLEKLLLHPLRHTATVFVFVFAVSLVLNLILWRFGEANLRLLLLQHTSWQPLLAGLVGLVPSCAASVAITQVFLKGGLSYGAAISGLCASAGLGLLVLFRENPNRRDTLVVLGLLIVISVAAGTAIQWWWG